MHACTSCAQACFTAQNGLQKTRILVASVECWILMPLSLFSTWPLFFWLCIKKKGRSVLGIVKFSVRCRCLTCWDVQIFSRVFRIFICYCLGVQTLGIHSSVDHLFTFMIREPVKKPLPSAFPLKTQCFPAGSKMIVIFCWSGALACCKSSHVDILY